MGEDGQRNDQYDQKKPVGKTKGMRAMAGVR